MLTLANPLGLLALLGIPAVLAIHFLQRKAVELPVSTLFLLEHTRRDAASGRKFERIIPSIPLWMQLLAVLLLAWFLAEPRFQREGSVQRIAVVLDSSASMQVFKDAAVKRLLDELPALREGAAGAEFTVLESIPDKPRIYAGDSVEDLKDSLEKWAPLGGVTDPTQALRLARSLVSTSGTVIYLTDTPAESLPFEARLLAVGEPVENVGVTGVSFGTEEGSVVWRALVRNYGKEKATRTWTLEMEGGASTPREFTLEPGALVTLQSAFPKDGKNVRLVLSPDRFTLDDTLPMVAPRPKLLRLFTAVSPSFTALNDKLLHSLDAAEPTNDAATADLAIASYDPLDPVLPPGNSIVFVEDGTSQGSYLKGGIVAEQHVLMDGLNWQAFLVRETIELDRLPTDTVLLWQEKRPLIFLRDTVASEGKPAARQLCFNFDLRLSNAESQPAFIVLLHRFAESLRAEKVASQALMLEAGQQVRVTSAPNAPLQVSATDLLGKAMALPATPNQAPSTPGYLKVRQGETELLDAAVYFADTREADFSECGRAETAQTGRADQLARNTRPDPLWRVWILLLIAAVLVAWKFNERKVTA